MKESNESSRFYGTMIRTDLRAYLYTGRCWLANNVQTVSHRCLPSYRDFDSTCINADCTHILYLAHLVRNASSRFFFFFFIFFFEIPFPRSDRCSRNYASYWSNWIQSEFISSLLSFFSRLSVRLTRFVIGFKFLCSKFELNRRIVWPTIEIVCIPGIRRKIPRYTL